MDEGRFTHNPEVAGSNPAPATSFRRSGPFPGRERAFCVSGTVVKRVAATALRPARQRDGGDGVTRDETAWTWWTLPPAISGCRARRYLGAHRSLRVRVGRAGTRVAATGLGQVRRMSAVSAAIRSARCSPCSSSPTTSRKPRCRCGAFCPTRIANVAANAARAAAVARSRTGRQGRRRAPAGSLLTRAGPDPHRHARGAPALSPRRGEPRLRGGAPARSPRAGQRTAAGAARGASSPASTVACRSTGSS